MRSAENRVKNWNGTVHWTNGAGEPACGPLKTHRGWLAPSVATVTCKRCIAMYGLDEPGHADPVVDTRHPAAIQRELERAARQAARGV